jgi:hypothetical protein
VVYGLSRPLVLHFGSIYWTARSGFVHIVSVWNLGSDGSTRILTVSGRSLPTFIGPALLQYRGEQRCEIECRYYPSDTGYIWKWPNGPEVATRLSHVIDTWPHVATAYGLSR